MQTYCLTCRKTTDNASIKKFIIKVGRLNMCTIGGSKKTKYINRWSRSLDSLVINHEYEQR